MDNENPSKILKIGSHLEEPQRDNLVNFLKENLDIIAWTHKDMVGISPEIIYHHLNIQDSVKPIKQKRRAMDPNRYQALKEEVDRLLKIDFTREDKYPQWVANAVLVKKPNGK